MTDIKSSFSGSIPEYYDAYLGPAWFDAFAADLALRLPARPPGNVLEIACGTGRVTRHLRQRLDPAIGLVATDLSKAMLEYARGKVSNAGIEWREADAMNLPFADGGFGAVVCAFGVMFVPDKAAAFREARRVLAPGGLLLFNVWDRLEENPHALANDRLVTRLFPNEPDMHFSAPFEMHDRALLRGLLAGARFRETRIEAKRIQVDGVSARDIAIGSIRGTPRSAIFEQRGIPLERMIEESAAALAEVGGADPYRAPAQAVVVEAVAA